MFCSCLGLCYSKCVSDRFYISGAKCCNLVSWWEIVILPCARIALVSSCIFIIYVQCLGHHHLVTYTDVRIRFWQSEVALINSNCLFNCKFSQHVSFLFFSFFFPEWNNDSLPTWHWQLLVTSLVVWLKLQCLSSSLSLNLQHSTILLVLIYSVTM